MFALLLLILIARRLLARRQQGDDGNSGADAQNAANHKMTPFYLLAGAAVTGVLWGERVLLLTELEYNTGRIPDVVLMAPEAIRGRDLRHHVLYLNRFDGDEMVHVVIEPAAGRAGESILRH
jgi:hypothetical protein